jgi:hypothetical protein
LPKATEIAAILAFLALIRISAKSAYMSLTFQPRRMSFMKMVDHGGL